MGYGRLGGEDIINIQERRAASQSPLVCIVKGVYLFFYCTLKRQYGSVSTAVSVRQCQLFVSNLGVVVHVAAGYVSVVFPVKSV